MQCEKIELELGRYLDGELPASKRMEVETHLAQCTACRCEHGELRELATKIAAFGPAEVPRSLWARIEGELHEVPTYRATSNSGAAPHRRWRTMPWAIAASIVLAVGLGLFGISSLDPSAHASTVDFRVLLDALPLDAQKAFRKFLMRYDAKPTTPVAAKRIASELNFETPAILPGGFRLQSVYELRIGGAKGIAAAYDRDGEFLAAVFHPPMKHEKFGSHENYPCVIGEHCGHKVQVGEWKLIHLTDPTTCHCLLSRLDEKTEIPTVMAAIAPELSEQGGVDAHHHP